MSSGKDKPTHFRTLLRADVPQGRKGKHRKIVTQILDDLRNLKEGSALQVPFSALAESKEKVRSALNRATHKAKRNVATASDADSFYVWNVTKK